MESGSRTPTPGKPGFFDHPTLEKAILDLRLSKNFLRPTYWEERYFPWVDVAHLHLNQTLTFADMDQLEFDANWTHDCINLPLARTADDFASMGHARALIYKDAREARHKSPQPHRV